MKLAEDIHTITGQLPKAETFGLVSQMRGCAVSIPSNIAEGKKRGSRKDFMQFLRIANGSAAELETQLMLLHTIYPRISVEQAQTFTVEIQKMLTVMLKKLASTSSSLPATSSFYVI